MEQSNGPKIEVEAPAFGEECQHGTKIIGNGNEVVLSLEFPDNRISIRLTPQVAHELAGRLIRKGLRASTNGYKTALEQ